MSHRGSTVSFGAIVREPVESEALDTATRQLHRDLDAYCDRYGYEALRSTVEVRQTLRISTVELVLTATVRARYDSDWGSVRRALDEDGLLRPDDRADAPAGFWGDPVPTTVTFGPVAASTPTVGDIWHDTYDDRMYVYSDKGWREVTVPADPETVGFPEPELWWPADEICVRPEIVANRAHWKQLYEGVWTHEAIEDETIVAADGSSRTLSAGDTISWTTTVNLTAD